jgi:hypothetical protein
METIMAGKNLEEQLKAKAIEERKKGFSVEIESVTDELLLEWGIQANLKISAGGQKQTVIGLGRDEVKKVKEALDMWLKGAGSK